MNFVETVRYFRSTHNLMQGEMGKISGVSKCTISNLECGVYNPSPRTVYRVTKAMQMPPDEIGKVLHRKVTAGKLNKQNTNRGNTVNINRLSRQIGRLFYVLVVIAVMAVAMFAYLLLMK